MPNAQDNSDLIVTVIKQQHTPSVCVCTALPVLQYETKYEQHQWVRSATEAQCTVTVLSSMTPITRMWLAL